MGMEIQQCFGFYRTFSHTIRPVFLKKYSDYAHNISLIKNQPMWNIAKDPINLTLPEALVSSLGPFYPKDINTQLAAEANFSFKALVRYVDMVCSRVSDNNEAFVRLMFSSLTDALNLESDTFKLYYDFYPTKDDNGYLNFLVLNFKKLIRQLPSFETVRDCIDTYIAQYIELKTILYCSPEDEQEVLLTNFGAIRGKGFPNITQFEYCTCIESTLFIELMLALASSQNLDNSIADDAEGSFFPWIPGIQKMLESYIKYNEGVSSDVSILYNYSNLKECEMKITYFIDRAEVINRNHYYSAVLKLLLAMYLTKAKAHQGMNKITTRELLNAGGRGMGIYYWCIKLLRRQ